MSRLTRTFWVPLLVLGLIAVACESRPKVAYKELLDDDPEIRADAAKRLGKAKAPEAIDSLVAVLDDPDEVVRVQAARALGEIGDPRAVPGLAGLIDDPLSTVRVACAQALGRIGDESGVPVLGKLLYDEEDRVRMVATRGLGRIPGEASLDVLLNVALRDESEWVRQHVVQVLGEWRIKEAIPKIESALIGEADIVRSHATRILGELGDRSSLPALLRALEDPFYKVRSLAAHSLWKIAPGDERVREGLRTALEVETHEMCQVDLSWNLARMGDDSGLGLIREMLFKGDPEDVRAEAAWALGEVGDESDIPRLERALNDRKGLVRKQAYLAIEKLKKG
jgi:HEAT repeat protein